MIFEHKIFRHIAIFSTLLIFICAPLYASQKSHTVFFEGEENELHVYRIKGEKPGKTLLIIGGIQGDEPGGFLAADFYVDYLLEKGNLIVVPRANFPSILKMERKINQDMNRKFLDDDISNYEAKVVDVLKELICESDCFLNLHEGSGIYSPTWISDQRNPKRYGQSIIADSSGLMLKGGKSIDLKAMAFKVIEKINKNINLEKHYFHFNNHKTDAPDTLHKEQIKSATYFAHTVCKIPAFGIESAKFLPIEQKVNQHIYAITGFMELLDIVPKTPGVDLKKPQMQYMIISVNNSIPVVVGKMQRLKIKQGDTIQVHDIVANYERGLSVDVIGLGNQFNDMKKPLSVVESTRIVAKKDFYQCGSVFIDIDSKSSRNIADLKISESTNTRRGLQYKLRINGKLNIADNYSSVVLKKGDHFLIEDLLSGSIDPSKYIVNFKGFVGNRQNNSGEDRGYVVDTSKGVLMERYSLDKKGRRYNVVTTLDGKEVGKLFINIKPSTSKEM